MELKSKTERLDARIPSDISRAAAILRDGGIVAFPTETVYGLGANALSSEAVARIFAAKKRPSWDPLIVHICDREMLGRVADVTPPFPLSLRSDQPAHSIAVAGDKPGYAPAVFALMGAFWPGPLTLLLRRTGSIPDAVTAGRALAGVRMPSHPVALELIRQAGVPLAAPSANLFGHTSPTTAGHVLADLDGRIDAVLDGGPTEVGVESTVAEITPSGAIVYRPGAISLEMLDSILGAGAARPYEATRITEPQSLPSPGTSLRHYAPRAELLLHQARQPLPAAAERFCKWIDLISKEKGSLGVMLPDDWPIRSGNLVFRWGPWDRLDVLAQRLYSGLHELDQRGAATIACPLPGAAGLGFAIQDRLQKAGK